MSSSLKIFKGASPRRFIISPKTAGAVVRAWVGESACTRADSGASTYQSVCALAQTALYCASGRRKDTEHRATENDKIKRRPLWSFRSGGANQTFPFLNFSPFGGGVGGGAGKNARKFFGLHARVRERVRGAFSLNQDSARNTFELCLIHTAKFSRLWADFTLRESSKVFEHFA